VEEDGVNNSRSGDALSLEGDKIKPIWTSVSIGIQAVRSSEQLGCDPDNPDIGGIKLLM
jgi:hypothetical protein